MTTPIAVKFIEPDLEKITTQTGTIALHADENGTFGTWAKQIDTHMRHAITRLTQNDTWQAAKIGDVFAFGFPPDMAADQVIVAKLPASPTPEQARIAGANLATQTPKGPLVFLSDLSDALPECALGIVLRKYDFVDHKSKACTPQAAQTITISCADAAAQDRAFDPYRAVAEGVFLTRDLTNAPANILTTTAFANKILAMQDLGLKVTILEEDDLAKLGMNALLGVGQGSESPSKVAVMSWQGGSDEAPLALIGKGVVFDTGGISLKPANGMEDMTMDMGGAAVVVGVMSTLARREAKANVVGVVGLVENMPDGKAQRPGDVVTSMKGDTIEVINTDAEGRLVLADIMWYAQDTFTPSAMIDFATLTGAIIIGLGHENAGLFSNDDDFCQSLTDAARAESEGAWRMPMGQAYDDMLKSNIADMKNIGGRDAGSITAAQFLGRFVKDGTPWVHVDIAGVASVASGTALSPKGATGWGVRSINRLIQDNYEPKA